MAILKFVGLFVLRMVVGAVLFAIIAGVAYVLSLGTEWLSQQGTPEYLHRSVSAVVAFLFGLDVLCFVVFAVGETIKFIREIVRDVRQ